ncbi:hypothetical protein HAZT_HAZT003661 [Hyalella azteca]|uniref:Mannosyltransferase n=1 Tax=Hyalella azteca TaxID=294128 RepID=A0A6A0H551_HYAAZ|nr:hypothetical protein HAZT_HAZT003661 [Hyalella azteca]
MIAESLLTGVAFGYLILAPYTKVEESFNIQACHDMLYHGPFLSRYDHHEYPGVVPRSFLGPAMLSTLALPFVTTARVMGVNKIYSQYLVRLALSLLVVFAWSRFYQQVKKGFGMGVAVWFTAITITQFHFVYYLSRTLPNSFALIFALLSCSYWLEQNHKKFIVASGIGVAIFRIDLVLMLGPMLVHDLVTKRIGLKSCLFQSVTVGGTLLAVTVAFDSLLWGRWVWPEGEVFYYNTILNQSHHWGPLPWYFYSALPRALGASILFVPVGIVLDKRMRLLTAPALVMVALFSLLPHKELRFIIYVVPLFNVAAAYACQNLYMRCRKSTRWSALSAVVVGHLLLNCLLTALLASASAANYPGGVALWRLHELVPAEAHVSVHIDNLAAQSGATRFLQMHPNWHYNKTEDLRPGSRELRSFSHLLVEAKNKYAYNLKHYADTHRILEAVEAFSHLSFNYQQFPPVKVRI